MPYHFKDIDPIIHDNRMLLRSTMESVGFSALFFEWWHFSYGDQYWAMAEWARTNKVHNAIYGRVEEEKF